MYYYYYVVLFTGASSSPRRWSQLWGYPNVPRPVSGKTTPTIHTR